MPRAKFPKTLTRRAKWARGQMGGVIQMMNEDRSFYEVLIQLLAVKGAVDKLIYPHLHKELCLELLTQINQLLQLDNLSTETILSLEKLKLQLSHCEPCDIPSIHYQLNQIRKSLNP